MTDSSPRQRSPIGGLVQEFEQAVGDWNQSLSPRGAGTPDKLATPSTLLDSSQTSPLCTDSWPTSPNLGVSVASPRSGKGRVPLVTDVVLDTRIEQLTHAMYAHMARAIRDEIKSFDSTLQGSFDALEARCEALEKKGGGHAQELERHEQDHRALADRVDGLQRQSAEQDQRVAQRLDQLGHTGGQALDNSLRLQESVGWLELANQQVAVRVDTLQEQAGMLDDSHKAQEQDCKAPDSLRLLGTRLDKMSQDHKESVGALELANQHMVVRLETLQEQASMLHDSHKAQEQEFKALSQDHKESLGWLELANQQMGVRIDTLQEQASMLDDSHKAQEQEWKALQRQVKNISSQVYQVSEQDTCLARHVDTELQRLEDMLNGPAPSVKSDLENLLLEMENFKDKLHGLGHARVQDWEAGRPSSTRLGKLSGPLGTAY